ncbi:hypothetical protein EVAR_53983_1 [Eumeta japonica]|uniref:Uncharacterized protein n=1 Tax=Eumeta variegata TaxID=151549 RepID=A0A4C1YPW5_EUMVA|nr:hypothetical protein EVAR_53983_1 [Eumeta japonica]
MSNRESLIETPFYGVMLGPLNRDRHVKDAGVHSKYTRTEVGTEASSCRRDRSHFHRRGAALAAASVTARAQVHGRGTSSRKRCQTLKALIKFVH